MVTIRGKDRADNGAAFKDLLIATSVGIHPAERAAGSHTTAADNLLAFIFQGRVRRRAAAQNGLRAAVVYGRAYGHAAVIDNLCAAVLQGGYRARTATADNLPAAGHGGDRACPTVVDDLRAAAHSDDRARATGIDVLHAAGHGGDRARTAVVDVHRVVGVHYINCGIRRNGIVLCVRRTVKHRLGRVGKLHDLPTGGRHPACHVYIGQHHGRTHVQQVHYRYSYRYFFLQFLFPAHDYITPLFKTLRTAAPDGAAAGRDRLHIDHSISSKPSNLNGAFFGLQRTL